MYPRKEKKLEAWEIWQRDGLEQVIEDIAESVQRFSNTESWKRENGKFIPMPTTFLNGRRFLEKPAVMQYQPPGMNP
jgi:hypothetical protein